MENVTNESDDFLLMDNWNDPVVAEFELNNPARLHPQSPEDPSIDQYIFDALGSSDVNVETQLQPNIYDSLWSTQNEYENDPSPFYLQNLSPASTSSSTDETPSSISSAADNRLPKTESTESPSTVPPGKLWEVSQIQHVMDSPTNPIGKFLRDAHISASLAAKANIMPFLVQVCVQFI